MLLARGRFKALCASLSSLTLFSQPDAASSGLSACLVHHVAERYGPAASCYTALRRATGAVMPVAYYQADAATFLQTDPVPYLREAAATYSPARLRLAEWWLEHGSAPLALPLVAQLLAEAPGSARVQYLAGRAKGSLEHLREAVRLEPRFGQAHYALALALRRAGDAAGADTHFRLFREHAKAAVAFPDPLLDAVRARKQSGADHLLAGRRAEESGDGNLARASYEKALQADPQLAQAHVNLIAVYARLGDFPRAEASYRNAAASNLPEAFYNWGVALSARNEFAAAESEFRRALAINPRYADALNNLGFVLQARGDRTTAEAQYRLALEYQPDHREARFNLARLLSLAGKAEAVSHFIRALERDDARATIFRYYFADHYRRQGEHDEAIRQAQLALASGKKYGQTDLVGYLTALLREWRQ
jgi:tetratricopeptide (TPR) repeat protein